MRDAPQSTISTLLASLSESTQKQYSSTYVKWWKWCNDKNILQFHPSTKNVMEFLQQEFEIGASFTVLNTHRSALALLFSFSADESYLIKRFLKGAFRIKPIFPKYKYIWDPSIVLSYIEKQNTQSLTLPNLTLKLVTLLALTTAQRVQTLTKINIDDIQTQGEERIDIFISEIIKTSAPTRRQPVLSFPFFVEKPELCVATTLLRYLPFRSADKKQLLLTSQKPFHPATLQTVSRWIKTVLNKSGIDTEVFKSHSTRHASTSAAARAGLPIDTIRQAAGWTEKSQVFNKFYNKPVIDSSSFAKSIVTMPM